MRYPGTLITFEGLDGCGKTTQLAMQVERLRGKGRRVTSSKEPGGTSVGQQIREIVLYATDIPLSASTELALMFAARAQHLQEVILPGLQRGDVILCDRFTDSSIAYQGYGRGVPVAAIQRLDDLLCQGMRPALTLVLDVDPETAARRTGSRNRAANHADARFEEEGLEFFRRVRQGYQEIAQQEPQRVRVIDACASIEEVHQRVSGIMDDFLKASFKS